MRKLSLVLSLLLAPSLTAQTIISIDASADRHRISPEIYGVNFATQAQLLDLNVPLNRSGGNAETRYNWQQNSSNRASDWYYESLEAGPNVPGAAVDDFITATKAGAAQPMITIPIIGWVSKLGPQRQRLSSFSVAKYGPQQSTDWQWFPDAGNGIRTDGSKITNNDPHDANMPADAEFQRGWVQHLVNRWGAANAGGVRYYLLDNEHTIWQGTHRDVKPVGANMDELWQRMSDHARMIKQVDPNAVVVGPEEWGWMGLFYSGYDQQWASDNNNWWTWPDKTAHAGWEYFPWLLTKFREHEMASGQRLLDVLTTHWYPQGGEYSSNVTSAMQLRRNRSTRSLWDPNYTDETRINDKVRLLPRLREWVAKHYPLTRVGITEYSWGADDHINGATAQADVLGIFGRERIDLATRWVTPDTNTPAYNAIKMYRNYDGAKSTFGDIGVRATVPNPDNVAAFASVRTSDQALTVMLINKIAADSAVTINVANYAAGAAAQRWQLTSSNTITRVADVPANALSLTLPAQSITLLVIPGSTDIVDPSVELLNSTLNADGTWTFSGTASDAVRVAYEIAGGASGNASGTASWSTAPLRLALGWNVVTFTAFDAAGNAKSVSTTIVQELATPAPTPPRRRRSVS